MALNLKNYRAESRKQSKGRNINGGNPLKNAPIVIHSISSHALKNATNDTIDSKAMNVFPKIPMPRNRPPHSSHQFKCMLKEDVKQGIVDLKKNSGEEKFDLELNLKLSETCLDKQDISSDASSTFAQIQPSCASSKGPPRTNYTDCKPRNAKHEEQELICLGCKNCHLYVMVPSENPKCPNCLKNKYFIDIPNGNPIKRAQG